VDKLSRREICAVNFLPPCEKAPPTFNQKSELRVTLKKGTYCFAHLLRSQAGGSKSSKYKNKALKLQTAS